MAAQEVADGANPQDVAHKFGVGLDDVAIFTLYDIAVTGPGKKSIEGGMSAEEVRTRFGLPKFCGPTYKLEEFEAEYLKRINAKPSASTHVGKRPY
ncbi:hypothetical protein ABE85_08345 [Mitsuaria sp. 7]|nr:hypothetical protein ABE85_08345 [Mitsuaria sp. 7]